MTEPIEPTATLPEESAESTPETKPRKKRSGCLAGCGVVVVFALGFFTGLISLLVFLGWLIPLSEGWKSEESKKFVAQHLANQLELTDEQRQEIEPIVREALDERWEMRRTYFEENRKLIRDKYLPRVEEFLTDEQKEKARRMLDRWWKEKSFRVEPLPGESNAEDGN
ncbi:MAG: hypothetical protein HKN23_16340 [Verrucomicrobiales bacterium]|nr:hypothetical protein [Verrucomicrobiales bacterium]